MVSSHQACASLVRTRPIQFMAAKLLNTVGTPLGSSTNNTWANVHATAQVCLMCCGPDERMVHVKLVQGNMTATMQPTCYPFNSPRVSSRNDFNFVPPQNARSGNEFLVVSRPCQKGIWQGQAQPHPCKQHSLHYQVQVSLQSVAYSNSANNQRHRLGQIGYGGATTDELKTPLAYKNYDRPCFQIFSKI